MDLWSAYELRLDVGSYAWSATEHEESNESLILAQDKRWRRALRMQVERTLRGEWRTGE
jgi:hypothetical protein